MIYVSTTNVQGFIYYFGIFYLKIGKFYTFFSIGKGAPNGPQNQPRKIPDTPIFICLMSEMILNGL